MKRKRSKLWSIPENELQEVVSRSNSITEILEYYGLRNSGGNYLTLKMVLIERNINYDNIKLGLNSNKNNKRRRLRENKSLSDILVENSSYKSGQRIRSKLLENNLIEDKCSKCGLSPIWNGEKLVLVLDHINGNHFDNRLENLRLLCPNCNSQTDTFCGKNKKYILK